METFEETGMSAMRNLLGKELNEIFERIDQLNKLSFYEYLTMCQDGEIDASGHERILANEDDPLHEHAKQAEAFFQKWVNVIRGSH